MSLYHYLVRLESVLRSRHDIEVELLQVDVITIGVKFSGEFRFFNGSRLSMIEQLEAVGSRDYKRLAYKYHYQNADGDLVFRYDNSPHHPHVATFPHHKHISAAIVESAPPDLQEVLAEIDAIIYANSS